MSPETEALARELLTLGLAGVTTNSARANRVALQRMREGDSFYTFGIRILGAAWRRRGPGLSELAREMGVACGLPNPEQFLDGPGFINPVHAAHSWLQGLALLDATARAGGCISFGTGHPGAMVTLYRGLAARISRLGGLVVPPAVGTPAAVDGWIDAWDGVAFLSDGCGALHSHATSILDGTLALAPRVDLFVGDHGTAGSAINAQIPCIAFMDTNDPALMAARHLERTRLLVIPAYDNLPNGRTDRILDALPRPDYC